MFLDELVIFFDNVKNVVCIVMIANSMVSKSGRYKFLSVMILVDKIKICIKDKNANSGFASVQF